MLLDLLFRVYDTFILCDEQAISGSLPLLGHLGALLKSLLISIESFQKDPIQLAMPAQHLFNIFNDPNYHSLKTLFESQEPTLMDEHDSSRQTPRSQESSSVDTSTFRLDQVFPNESGKVFNFSEIGRLGFNKNALSFKKLREHPGFKYVPRLSVQSIETLSIKIGVSSNFFIEPGTFLSRQIYVSQEMIERAQNNIVVLNYEVSPDF